MSKLKLCFVFMLCAVSTLLHAYDDTPGCFRRLETGFFNQRLVYQTLSNRNVYENQWETIMNDLRRESRNVPKIIRQRSSKMSPDPLQNPFDPQKAQKLLMDVLYEIFSNVMHRNELFNQGILNQNDVDEMFYYIWSNQVEDLKACFITPYEEAKKRAEREKARAIKDNTVIDEEAGKPVIEQNEVLQLKSLPKKSLDKLPSNIN